MTSSLKKFLISDVIVYFQNILTIKRMVLTILFYFLSRKTRNKHMPHKNKAYNNKTYNRAYNETYDNAYIKAYNKAYNETYKGME